MFIINSHRFGFPPTVDTGTVADLTSTGFSVNANSITVAGVPATICRYGILYTQCSTVGTSSNLKYSDPIGTNISASLYNGNINVGVDWTNSASSLSAFTTTYYRAFAINCANNSVGYGAIGTGCTLPDVPMDITVCACWVGSIGASTGAAGTIELLSGSSVVVESRCFTQYFAGTCEFSWTNIPAGTYCVSFDNMDAYFSSALENKEETWALCTGGSGTDSFTDSFTYTTCQIVNYTIADI